MVGGGGGGEGRQSADRHRTAGWPGRVKGETGLLMESHCSLIKSFARRREGAHEGGEREGERGGGRGGGTASETETKENGGRGARQQVRIRSALRNAAS